MPKKKAPTGTDKDINLATLAKLVADEDKAREFLESKRWADGRFCPHCGCRETYALTARADSRRPVRPGVYKCKDCRKQFTVRVGTIFEDSKLPIGKWLMAIHLMTSSKKGVSSHQIARELGVTVKTAWFVTHRIRESMKLEPMAGMLKGAIEADETYVGGHRRFTPRGRPNPDSSHKTPVVALVQSDGNVVAAPVERLTSDCLRSMMDEVVDKPNSQLNTDQLPLYRRIGKEFGLGHQAVNHNQREYVRGDAHINTAESFFALLKRGHYGTFHLLSREHLCRYVTEFAFRWNSRKLTDGERMVRAIKGAEGKRLTYRKPVNQTHPEKAPGSSRQG